MEVSKDELKKLVSEEFAKFINDHINKSIYMINFDNLDDNVFVLTNFDYVPLQDTLEEYTNFIDFLTNNSGKKIEIMLLTPIQNWFESNDIQIPEELPDDIDDVALFVQKDSGPDEDDLYLVIAV